MRILTVLNIVSLIQSVCHIPD